MLRATIDGRLVASAVLLSLIAIGNQPSARADQRDSLRVPEAFASDAATGHTMRLDDRDGANAATSELVTERYPDGRPAVERQVALDTQGNYVNHGSWKQWAQDGTPLSEGQYNMGQRVGTWTRWITRRDSTITTAPPFNQFKPPFVSQVNFVDDKMEGQWLIVDADQRQIMQISLSDGKRNGTVTRWTPNGKMLDQATFDHGVPVGDVLTANAKPGTKAGEMSIAYTYDRGRRVVTKTDYWNGNKTKKKNEESFLAATTVEQTPDDFWTLTLAKYTAEGEDMRHGTSKSWYDNGKPEHEGAYDHGKKSGMFTWWHSNGQIAVTGEYQNDKPIGAWVWWHENGQKQAFGEYREGFLIGNWRFWDKNGQLTKQKSYDGSEKITSDKAEPEIEVGRRTGTTKPAR